MIVRAEPRTLREAWHACEAAARRQPAGAKRHRARIDAQVRHGFRMPGGAITGRYLLLEQDPDAPFPGRIESRLVDRIWLDGSECVRNERFEREIAAEGKKADAAYRRGLRERAAEQRAAVVAAIAAAGLPADSLDRVLELCFCRSEEMRLLDLHRTQRRAA